MIRDGLRIFLSHARRAIFGGRRSADSWALSVILELDEELGRGFLARARGVGIEQLRFSPVGRIRIGLPTVSFDETTATSPQEELTSVSRSLRNTLGAVGLSPQLLAAGQGSVTLYVSFMPSLGNARITITNATLKDWADLSPDVFLDVIA